ncbi:hypothetical protein C1645_836185 [Glomus cerebriforme]|uniref:HMG box domain-containing protein n=1 Tax=Glomus cerebriforme TaxID=658196 RepID=A0A397SB27_9GLOM|nr:hypothetical protein C1645_836185 [Glomus cerebriforme]
MKNKTNRRPRPPNAFSLFFKHNKDLLRENYPQLSSRERLKQAGKIWNSADAKLRNSFIKYANDERILKNTPNRPMTIVERSIVKLASGLIVIPGGIATVYSGGGGIVAGLKKTSITGMLITNPARPGPVHPVGGMALGLKIRKLITDKLLLVAFMELDGKNMADINFLHPQLALCYPGSDELMTTYFNYY